MKSTSSTRLFLHLKVDRCSSHGPKHTEGIYFWKLFCFIFVFLFFSGGFWLLVAFVVVSFSSAFASLLALGGFFVGFWLLWLLASLASTAVVLELKKLCCSQWPAKRKRKKEKDKGK